VKVFERWGEDDIKKLGGGTAGFEKRQRHVGGEVGGIRKTKQKFRRLHKTVENSWGRGEKNGMRGTGTGKRRSRN